MHERQRIEVGEFRRVYDPSVGESERWYLNDHTFFRDPEGTWHLIGITHAEPAAPFDERHGRRVVYRDPLSGTMAGPTESPFVFERAGRSYLLIGPDWQGLLDSHARTGRYDPRAYRRTRVLVSDDSAHFALDGQIATIDAHAAEVVVDESGVFWVSHCGWGQGGVYLAPLRWHDR